MSMDAASPRPTSPFDMKRRDLVIGGGLLAVAALTFARLPRTPIIVTARPIGDIVPRKVGEWQGAPSDNLVMAPDDERKAAAIYDQQLNLNYQHPSGAQIMMALAYAQSQSGMLMVHRPESCYPGSGFTITDDRATEIQIANDKVIPARFLTTQLLPRIEQVLYWTRLGTEFPTSWDEERETLAIQKLRGFIPDGILVRLSIINSDAKASFELLNEFAAELYKSSGEEGRALLVGPVSRA